MTLSQIVSEYTKIDQALQKKYPFPDREKRVFAKIAKVVEEFGELAEVLLANSNLQRKDKDFSDIQTKIEGEFADVIATVLLLGIELDVDIEKAIEKKIDFTHHRLKSD